jgi:predicted Zn-dependent protease with MMP-like domain
MDGGLPLGYHNAFVGSLWIVFMHLASSVAYCQTTLSQTAPPSGSLTADEYELILAALVAFTIVGLLLSSFGLRTKKFRGENERLESKLSEREWLLREREQNPEPTTLRYSQQEFEEMISNALEEIPPEFDNEWKNVAVTVSTGYATDEDKGKMGVPKDHLILGLYSGAARTRGVSSDLSSHVIVLYQPALESYCGSDKEKLVREIRRVVLHEFAHHLGMSHWRMREIGL